MSSASKTVKNRHCAAVAGAATLTKEEADKLSEQSEPLTPEQALSLEKFYIAEFYCLETVSPVEVAFDRNQRTRSEIKALEAVLSPPLANEVTAQSIHQNLETPQDWNPLAVKVWLLEQSGAAALIRGIASGEIEHLTAERVAPIADFIRAHPAEFRLAFRFKNVAVCTDQQILGEMLRRHGISTKRRGNQNNLRYEVQKAELEKLLRIIERRKPEIAPPQKEGINQGVCDPS